MSVKKGATSTNHYIYILTSADSTAFYMLNIRICLCTDCAPVEEQQSTSSCAPSGTETVSEGNNIMCFTSHRDRLQYRTQSPCSSQHIDLYFLLPLSALHSPSLRPLWMTICQRQACAGRGLTLNALQRRTPVSPPGLINLARNACEQSYHLHPDVPQAFCLHLLVPTTHTHTNPHTHTHARFHPFPRL